MEQLDYLIRTLTYCRSTKELQLKKLKDVNDYKTSDYLLLEGEINGLNIALSTIYKLINEISSDEEV